MLNNNYLLCAGYVLLLAASFATGILIGKKAPSKWKLGGLAGLFILFSCLILQYFFPEIEVQYITWPDYVFFRDWYFAGALLVFGIAVTKIDARNSRAIVIFTLFIILLKGGLWWNKLYQLDFEFKEKGFVKGVCMQSTGYTCAPCCCATLLSHYDITSSEKEMAGLCLTLREGGTQDIESIRGLRLKLAGTGYKVRLKTCTWEELLQIPKPCMASVKLANIAHMITVLRIDGDNVVAGDPIRGIFTYPKEEFVENWFKRAIWIEK